MATKLIYPIPVISCPHISLKNDLQTTLSYPSARNFCHRCHPTAVPNFSHQREFCLTSKYNECPGFLEKKISPMPEALLYHDHKPSNKQKLSTIRILFILILFLFVLFAVFILKTHASEEKSVYRNAWLEAYSFVSQES
jgi:hypothetical protein